MFGPNPLISTEVDPAAVARLSRSEGRLRLSFKRRGPLTVPKAFFQSGCLRARLLRSERGRTDEMIVVNTAGGLTGGDRLTTAVHWGRDTAMCLTGQAAEKIYRALSDPVLIDTELTLDEGAVGEWLPQETIFFNDAGLRRRTDVHVSAKASFLGLEAIVMGRTAMGEAVERGFLRDSWRVWREGKTIYTDVIELKGSIAEKLKRGAVAGGAIAFASLIFVGPECVQKLPGLRAALSNAQGVAAASAWNGLLAIRFMANTGAILRRDIIKALDFLRPGRTLPRVWRC